MGIGRKGFMHFWIIRAVRPCFQWARYFASFLNWACWLSVDPAHFWFSHSQLPTLLALLLKWVKSCFSSDWFQTRIPERYFKVQTFVFFFFFGGEKNDRNFTLFIFFEEAHILFCGSKYLILFHNSYTYNFYFIFINIREYATFSPHPPKKKNISLGSHVFATNEKRLSLVEVLM